MTKDKKGDKSKTKSGQIAHPDTPKDGESSVEGTSGVVSTTPVAQLPATSASTTGSRRGSPPPASGITSGTSNLVAETLGGQIGKIPTVSVVPEAVVRAGGLDLAAVQSKTMTSSTSRVEVSLLVSNPPQTQINKQPEVSSKVNIALSSNTATAAALVTSTSATSASTVTTSAARPVTTSIPSSWSEEVDREDAIKKANEIKIRSILSAPLSKVGTLIDLSNSPMRVQEVTQATTTTSTTSNIVLSGAEFSSKLDEYNKIQSSLDVQLLAPHAIVTQQMLKESIPFRYVGPTGYIGPAQQSVSGPIVSVPSSSLPSSPRPDRPDSRKRDRVEDVNPASKRVAAEEQFSDDQVMEEAKAGTLTELETMEDELEKAD